MAHEITSEDSLVLTGRPAWHGLGTIVQGAPTMSEALRLAGLEWDVLRRHVNVGDLHPDDMKSFGDRPLPAVKGSIEHKLALQRSDTGRVLEVVGDGYEVLQNRELAELVRELASEGTIPRAESAGSLKQGRRVFILVRKGAFNVGARDEVAEYLLFSNTHDGTGALGIIPTTVRVVCANTLRAAESGFRIRHSANMRDRIEQAKEALRLAERTGTTMRKTIERLAAVPMDAEDRRVFFLKVYEATHGIIPARPSTESEEKAQARALQTVAEWVANLDSARNSGTGTEGSVWHALNAATEWSDHKRTVRKAEETERSARAASNLFGTSAAFKAKALELAVAAAS
jgi:phage/plasmid-like protein (TIGR03299 family)